MTEADTVAEEPTPPPGARARLIGALRTSSPFLLLYGFYLTLAVWCFQPAFATLGTAFIGRPGSDVLRNAWGFWWFKAMLFERFRFPAYTTYLNFPRGMLILVIDPLNCLLSLPLQAVFGLPTAYNLYLIAVVAFSAFSASLFARYVTGSMGAGLLAGALYGFAPYVLSGSLSGNSEVVNVGWIPLYFLFFHRTLHDGARRDGRWAGILLICTTLSSWYYGYIASLFSALYGVGYLLMLVVRRQPVRERLRALAEAVGLFLLFSLIMLVLFREIIPSVQRGVGQGGQDQLTVLAGNAVNLWDMYRPSPERWHRPSLYHLPVAVLIALPVALLLGIRRAWSWALLGGVALLLAMSYRVQSHPVELRAELWGVWEQLTVSGKVAYDLFRKVPFSGVVRFPARFLVITNLMLGVTLACGAAMLMRGGPALQRLWLVIGAAGAVGLTGMLQASAQFHAIFSVTDVTVPEHVKRIAADPDWAAVVNLPTDLQGGLQLYYQTVHQKPLLNYVDFVTSRLYYINDLQIPLSYSDVLYGMQERGYDDHIQAYPDQVPDWPPLDRAGEQLALLKKAGLRYVVVERAKYKPQSLTDFETLITPFVTKVLSSSGVDLYRLK